MAGRHDLLVNRVRVYASRLRPDERAYHAEKQDDQNQKEKQTDSGMLPVAAQCPRDLVHAGGDQVQAALGAVAGPGHVPSSATGTQN